MPRHHAGARLSSLEGRLSGPAPDVGPLTDHAVRDVQARFAPPVDGVVGPSTWHALVLAKFEEARHPASSSSRTATTPRITLTHVTPGRDDEALSWGGDDDPTLDVGVGRAKDPGPEGTTGAAEPVAAAPVGLPEGFEAVGKGSHDVARLDADGTVAPDPAAAPLGNAMFVALGVFGGAYLLYAIGWVVGGMRLQGRLEYLVSDVMFQGSFWLAVLAPVLWFATVFLLTIRSAAWVRIAWLVGGALLLVPWPFILTGAVGR